jgi:hypothetical protein
MIFNHIKTPTRVLAFSLEIAKPENKLTLKYNSTLRNFFCYMVISFFPLSLKFMSIKSYQNSNYNKGYV